MKVKDLNKSKIPVVQIDKSLEQYKGKIIFKDKLEEANKTLKAVGIPPRQRKK